MNDNRILCKGNLSNCDVTTTWARFIQSRFISIGMRSLSESRPATNELSRDAERGRMLCFIGQLYFDVVTRAEHHLLSIPLLKMDMATDGFGSAYAEHASGHMDLISYWCSQRGGMEGLAGKSLMINSFLAHRILDDESTEEVESFLDHSVSLIQKNMRALERCAYLTFSVSPK